MKISTKMIARGAIIAALYAAVTLLLKPIGFGPWQLRVSEAMTALPMLLPDAIAGLTVGCFLANLLGSQAGPLDVIFGTLASLIAAILTRIMRTRLKLHPALCMLPPVIVNAIIIGIVLNVSLGFPLWASMLEVGLGQIAACYALGLPLYHIIQRVPGDLLK